MVTQNKVIAEIKNIIKNVQDSNKNELIQRIIVIPTTESSGVSFPAVFIEDESDIYEWENRQTAGCLFFFTQTINIYIHIKNNARLVYEANEIQVAITKAMQANLSLNEKVLNCNITNVLKGNGISSNYTDSNVNEEGYYLDRSVRKLTFEIQINEPRG